MRNRFGFYPVLFLLALLVRGLCLFEIASTPLFTVPLAPGVSQQRFTAA